MKIMIKNRDEYLNYCDFHYCKNCGHYIDCPANYLCPPLEEEWDYEEKYIKKYEEEDE